MAWLKTPIRGLLLDINGVLRIGNSAIDGSVEAFRRLKRSNLPFRLLTNGSQLSRDGICKKLTGLEFDVNKEHIFSPAPAMAAFLRQEHLTPHLLTHHNIKCEFEPLGDGEPNCVVVGDASHAFTYEAMNTAFNILLKLKEENKMPRLFSLGKGKYYMEKNGLMLGVGPFTATLEFATGLTAELIGKPSQSYFKLALDSLNLPANQVVMIGDDIIGDVAGAQGSGVRGVLVRTGKFQPSDESHSQVKPDAIVTNFEEAIDLILAQ